MRLLLVRAMVVAGVAAVVTLTTAGPASAHVTVNAASAVQGGYTKATFRVPNEKDAANTTVVEINLPTDTPIASVSIKPLPGWKAVAAKAKLAAPVKTDDGELTEAVNKITWTADAASAIKPGEFQEFDVSLGPLPKADQVIFKALQTYSDGDIVRWIDEPAAGEEPEHPAPVLKLAAAATEAAAPSAQAAAPVPAAEDSDENDDDSTNWLGIVGVLLGLAGLVVGVLAYRRAAQSATA